MAKQRDACVIEENIHLLLHQIRQHKDELHDEQCEQLLSEDPSSKNVRGTRNQQHFNNGVNYYKEFWRYYIINELIIKKISELSTYNAKLVSFTDDLEDLQNEYSSFLCQQNKKKVRRTSSQIEKAFACPYPDCLKYYGSDVSLNLHIKLKHQGGNKTDREKYAVMIHSYCQQKLIIEAKDTGLQIPDCNIKFPPGYLEVYQSKMTFIVLYKPGQTEFKLNTFR